VGPVRRRGGLGRETWPSPVSAPSSSGWACWARSLRFWGSLSGCPGGAPCACRTEPLRRRLCLLRLDLPSTPIFPRRPGGSRRAGGYGVGGDPLSWRHSGADATASLKAGRRSSDSSYRRCGRGSRPLHAAVLRWRERPGECPGSSSWPRHLRASLPGGLGRRAQVIRPRRRRRFLLRASSAATSRGLPQKMAHQSSSGSGSTSGRVGHSRSCRPSSKCRCIGRAMRWLVTPAS
jgi:hypothetical protein